MLCWNWSWIVFWESHHFRFNGGKKNRKTWNENTSSIIKKMKNNSKERNLRWLKSLCPLVSWLLFCSPFRFNVSLKFNLFSAWGNFFSLLLPVFLPVTVMTRGSRISFSLGHVPKETTNGKNSQTKQRKEKFFEIVTAVSRNLSKLEMIPRGQQSVLNRWRKRMKHPSQTDVI